MEEEPSTHVYVGNLSYNVTWQALRDCFSAVAGVRYVKIMEDKSIAKEEQL